MFRGELSPKRALALVEALPVESATVTERRGGAAYYGWDRQAYMTADLFDVVMRLLFLTLAVNSKDPKKVKPPKDYPRPDSVDKTPEPDILLKRLRGEDTPLTEAGPVRVIPLPPS